MRNSVINVIEMLIGSILIGLGLIYLMSQYKALSELTDTLTEKITKDDKIIRQYNNNALDQVTHAELCAAIMGYREYPIMVDDNLIPSDGQDYELYFSYVKTGLYKKEYLYDDNRNIIMLIFTFIGT